MSSSKYRVISDNEVEDSVLKGKDNSILFECLDEESKDIVMKVAKYLIQMQVSENNK